MYTPTISPDRYLSIHHPTSTIGTIGGLDWTERHTRYGQTTAWKSGTGGSAINSSGYGHLLPESREGNGYTGYMFSTPSKDRYRERYEHSTASSPQKQLVVSQTLEKSPSPLETAHRQKYIGTNLSKLTFTASRNASPTRARERSPSEILRSVSLPPTFDHLKNEGFEIDAIVKEQKINQELSKVTQRLFEIAKSVKETIRMYNHEPLETIKATVPILQAKITCDQERVRDSKRRLSEYFNIDIGVIAGSTYHTPVPSSDKTHASQDSQSKQITPFEISPAS